jgi:hypothetical protein
MTSAPTAPPTPEQIIGAQGRIKAAQAVNPVSTTVPTTAIDPNATIRDANYLNHLIK